MSDSLDILEMNDANFVENRDILSLFPVETGNPKVDKFNSPTQFTLDKLIYTTGKLFKSMCYRENGIQRNSIWQRY